MNKLQLITATSLLAVSGMATADVLGVYAGVQRWDYDVDGSINSGISNIDVNNDLGLGSDDNITKYVAFEHPVPFLPNVAIYQTDLRGVSNGTAGQTFDFNGITVNPNDSTQLVYNLDHDEYILYYEILDNWVNLDLGVSAKKFDGGVTVGARLGTNNGANSFVDISGTVPMLYGKAQFELPLSELSAGAQISLGQFQDDTLSDTKLYIAYGGEDTSFGLELGYRIFELEFDDFDALSSDLTIDGFYAGLRFHF